MDSEYEQYELLAATALLPTRTLVSNMSWKGAKGENVRQVQLYNEVLRREIDLELTENTIELMERKVRREAFFAYVPLTKRTADAALAPVRG